MSLPTIPHDILLCILDYLPSVSDRQCLRMTCSRLRHLIPPPPPNPIPAWAKHWPDWTQQVNFAERLLRDKPEEERRDRMVCEQCVRMVKYEVVDDWRYPEFGSRECKGCGVLAGGLW